MAAPVTVRSIMHANDFVHPTRARPMHAAALTLSFEALRRLQRMSPPVPLVVELVQSIGPFRVHDRMHGV